MAKLAAGDEAAVLKFARSYGRFGYYEMYQPPREETKPSPNGEPLEWIWAHAWTIDLCLELTEHLQNKDEALLADYLSDNFASEPWRGLETYRAEIAYRDEVVPRRWSRYGESLTDFARYIRMEIINRNIIGIRREFQDVEGRDQSFFVFSALVEVAYWQLADMLMQSERVIRCEACNAPFVQTDHRQRFCPRQFRQKESACGGRARVRKHRKGKKNG
jgi:hypothetical protein